MKFKRSNEFYKRACSLIPGGVNSPVRAFGQVGGKPIFVRKAAGSSFIDEDGNSYIDFCLSWGPLILGHSHPEVVDEVCKAAREGLSYGACHKREIELAELILEAVAEFECVRMVNSGTEAVMTAIRLARGITSRDLIVKFDGGYHGHVDSMLVKAGSGLVTLGAASSAGVPSVVAETTIVAQLDNEKALKAIFNRHGANIAAVIIEPIPANNGLLIQRTEFLHFLRDITRQYGSMLICDEVISGFRLHFGSYCQLIGIEPDLMTLGKIIGGGMPVGAIAGPRKYLKHLSPLGNVYQAGTLSGNSVSMAAGIATLKILRDNPPYEKLEQLGGFLINELQKATKTWIRAQRIGSILWPYFDRGDFPRTPKDISLQAMHRFTSIYHKMLKRGFYLPPSSYEVMFLCACHTNEQIKALGKAFVDCLLELKQ